MRRAFNKVRNVLEKLIASAPQPVESEAAPLPDLEDGWSWIPNWSEIFHGRMDVWHQYVEKAKDGPKVLIATCTGGNSAMTPMEALFAVALTLRGARVEIVLCDKALPACPNMITTAIADQEEFIEKGPNKCDWCFESGHRVYKDLGLPIHFLNEWIRPEDKLAADQLAQTITPENALSFIDDGVLVGHHAMTGTLRYFGRGDLNGEPNAAKIFKRFLQAGILANRALQRLFQDRQFEHTVLNQGIYVPQGVVVGVARKFNSSVAPFELGYRKQSIMMDDWTREFDESNEVWESLPWSQDMEDSIVNYLNSRRKGTLDWIKVQSEDGPDNVSQISEELGIDFSKPTIALLTNVIWDAQVFYPTNAFPTMIEWLKLSIDYFAKRPDLQLLIRIHPGELQGFVKSRQLAMDEIKRMFPTLPANVFVIPPESPINTYAAVEKCKAILIYATTAGIEFASMGYPVVVAGEAWIRNKGFSYDAVGADDYINLLSKLPFAETCLSGDKLQRARKYAYHHYFRRMVPLNVLDSRDSSNVPYTIRPVGIEGFLPGKDAGLDIICDGILEGSRFIYPAEKMQQELGLTGQTAHEFFTVGSPKH